MVCPTAPGWVRLWASICAPFVPPSTSASASGRPSSSAEGLVEGQGLGDAFEADRPKRLQPQPLVAGPVGGLLADDDLSRPRVRRDSGGPVAGRAAYVAGLG